MQIIINCNLLWLRRVPPSGAGQSARARERVTSPENTRDIWRRRRSAEPECLLPSEQLCLLPLPLAREVSTLRALAQLDAPRAAATLNWLSPQWWVLSSHFRGRPPHRGAGGHPWPCLGVVALYQTLLIFTPTPWHWEHLMQRPPSVFGRRVGLFHRRLGPREQATFGFGFWLIFYICKFSCGGRWFFGIIGSISV